MLTRRKIAAGIAALAVAAAVVWQASAEETIRVSDVSHVHGLAVDKEDPSRLYLATHYGVYRTGPDGAATRVSGNKHDYMGFSPHPDPDKTGVFYASGHPAGGGNLGVILSEDGAKTWQQISEGANGPVDFHAMDVSPADPSRIYGYYGDIQVSRDGGRSWEVAGRPGSDTFDVAASAKDPDTVYAATREGLMRSQDAATTWAPAHIVTKPSTMVEVANDGTAYAFQVETGLLKTAEPSLGWSVVSSDFGDSVLLHLAVHPENTDLLYAVTQDSKILRSDDGGKTWKSYTES
jgi:photosystem II stability/assembly factor-like uncharacterized protein